MYLNLYYSNNYRINNVCTSTRYLIYYYRKNGKPWIPTRNFRICSAHWLLFTKPIHFERFSFRKISSFTAWKPLWIIITIFYVFYEWFNFYFPRVYIQPHTGLQLNSPTRLEKDPSDGATCVPPEILGSSIVLSSVERKYGFHFLFILSRLDNSKFNTVRSKMAEDFSIGRSLIYRYMK